MKAMNEILSDIVVASGGSVTDPDNRNSLLMDIVTSSGGSVTDPDNRNSILSDIISSSGGDITDRNDRNSLLNDIVTSSGGTVTDPNNRNSLLDDWLSAASGASLLPLNSRLVFEGDSVTQGAGYLQISSQYIDGVGSLPDGYNQGVGGQTTSDALAGISQTLAENPDITVVYLGINDLLSAATTALITSNLRGIYDQLISADSRVVAVKLYEISPLPPEREVVRNEVNEWISQQTDLQAAVDTSSILLSDLRDGVHPNWSGRDKLGILVGAALDAAFDNGDILAGYLTVDNKLFTEGLNPQVAGTGGAVNGGSGVFADGWEANSATDATLVYSKTTLDGLEAQRVQITGISTGDTFMSMRLRVYNINDTESYYSALRCVTSSVVGLRNIRLSFTGFAPAPLDTDPYESNFDTIIRTSTGAVPTGETSRQILFDIYMLDGEVDIDMTFNKPIVVLT